MLQQAYGEDFLSRMSIEDGPTSGRPSMPMDDDHVEKVLAVIRQIRHLSVREVC